MPCSSPCPCRCLCPLLYPVWCMFTCHIRHKLQKVCLFTHTYSYSYTLTHPPLTTPTYSTSSCPQLHSHIVRPNNDLFQLLLRQSVCHSFIHSADRVQASSTFVSLSITYFTLLTYYYDYYCSC